MTLEWFNSVINDPIIGIFLFNDVTDLPSLNYLAIVAHCDFYLLADVDPTNWDDARQPPQNAFELFWFRINRVNKGDCSNMLVTPLYEEGGSNGRVTNFFKQSKHLLDGFLFIDRYVNFLL